MSIKKIKNRWMIAACSVGIHISIGSVYAYSILKRPINELLGWDMIEISKSFSLAILFLGLSAAFLGKFVENKGPRIAGTVSAIFYSLGLIGSGYAINADSLPLFYFFYGVIGGIGLGIGYITPVSTLVKWFPDKRGLATGMAIMGFGFSAMIFGPIMAKLINMIGVSSTMCTLGVIFLVVMLSSAQYLEKPKEGWLPEHMKENKNQKTKRVKIKQDLAQLTAPEAAKTLRFYCLWFVFFVNITCGIAIISIASPFAQQAIGMTAMQAAFMVGMMGLFNGVGRIGWSSLSDKVGRMNMYTIFFFLQAVCFFILPSVKSAVMFQVVIFFILTCYGGGFAMVPAFIGDLFGTKQLAVIHGYTLTAWSMAGLFGPILSAKIKETTGSYAQSLYIYGALFTAAFLVALIMQANIKKIRKQKSISC